MNCLFIYDGEIIEIECIMETDQSCVSNIQYNCEIVSRNSLGSQLGTRNRLGSVSSSSMTNFCYYHYKNKRELWKLYRHNVL